jgi:hypothetical protein
MVRLQMAQALERVGRQIVATPFKHELLRTVVRLVDVAKAYDVDMWMVQNHYNVVWQRDYPLQKSAADRGDTAAMDWTADFRNLGEHLNMAIISE